jgi:hypothetical protein
MLTTHGRRYRCRKVDAEKSGADDGGHVLDVTKPADDGGVV